MSEEVLQKIKDREGVMQPLFSRMDLDRDLYWLSKYEMKDKNGRAISKGIVHNVTFNDPLTFAFRVINNLNAAFEQVVVEGEGMDDKQTSYIEDFIKTIFAEIDQCLRKSGIVSASAYENEQSCIRGRIAARVLMRKKKGALIPDVRHMDTRFLTYAEGYDGIPWYSYTSSRPKAEVILEYQLAEQEVTSPIPDVRDYWEDKKNIVFVDDKPVKTRNNRWGHPPLVYVKVPAGSMLADGANIGHEGESLFSLDRDLYPELNDAVSVLKTIHRRAFASALQWETENPAEDEAPEQPPMEDLSVTAVGKGMGFKNMPVSDMRNAARQFLSMLETRLQRGALPSVDYGNLNFPLSAVAVKTLEDTKDAVYVPRLSAKAEFRRCLARTLIEQFISYGEKAEFGPEGHRKVFDPAKLKGSYELYFRYYSNAPQEIIANYSIAAAAYGAGYSRETIMRDVLKDPNPTKQLLLRKAEDAEEADPVLKLYNYVHSLIDVDTPQANVQAKILAMQVVGMVKQRRMALLGIGQSQAVQPTPRPGDGTAQALMPLLGGSNRPQLPPAQQNPDEQFASEEQNRENMASTNRLRREGENAGQ